MAKTCIGSDRIKKMYVGEDRIRRAYVGSDLVFSAESVLFQNGSTDESGTWSVCHNGYMTDTMPVIDTKIKFPTAKQVSSYGRLAVTDNKINFSGSHTISFDISDINFSLHTGNVAPDHYWTARLYVIFLPEKVTSLEFNTENWIENYDKAEVFSYAWGPTVTQSESRAGASESIDFTLNGDYYVGFVNCGYNCNTTEFTINNVILE